MPGTLEVMDKLVKRSILIKEVIDVISEAKTYEQLLENVDKEKLFPLLESGKSFKFNIEGGLISRGQYNIVQCLRCHI